jgi:HAMP domain-containing protein
MRPLVRVTEATLSVRLDDRSWLNAARACPARARRRSAPRGALVSVIIVGIGAALVSRQIGRPLSDLANAARALGSGQTNVAAPVSGPEDVRRASTAFNAMAERFGRQLSRQRQMLWALSHDLRTPITAIRLRAELIEDEAERQRLLASVAEMETLTEQALSLARAGASEEARVNVDLAEIARTLCGELQDMGVNITAEANGGDGGMPPQRNRARHAQPGRERRQVWRRRRDARLSQRSERGRDRSARQGPGVAPGLLEELTARSSAPTKRAQRRPTAQASASPSPKPSPTATAALSKFPKTNFSRLHAQRC